MAAVEKKPRAECEPMTIGVVALSIHPIHSCHDSSRLVVTRHVSAHANGWRRYADNWDGAVDTLKPILDELPDSIEVYFYVEYCPLTWTHLPRHMALNLFRNIKSITIRCYPTLEHIDLRDLPNLTRFDLTRPYHVTVPCIGQHLRISGLAQCPHLEYLCFFDSEGDPYLLQINAPVRNLRALVSVSVGSSCMNRRLPLELGSSPKLKLFHFNGKTMLRTIKAKRSFATCLCIALHNLNAFKSTAFAKAIAYGPIHDPSLVHDVANKLSFCKT